MTRWLVLLVALLALTAISTPAQTPAGSYFNSFSEPLPNCTPGGVGVRMPVAWDITAQKFMYCSATNTWTQWPGTGGGGGGTPGGADTNVQYNCSGAFCGDGNFVWNYTGQSLTVIGKANSSQTLTAGVGGVINLTQGASGNNSLGLGVGGNVQLAATESGSRLQLSSNTELRFVVGSNGTTWPASLGSAGQALISAGGNPQTLSWNYATKKLVLPYALCAAGATPAAAWDTPAASSAVAACKVGGVNSTVQGVLQFADAQLAYYSGMVPADWLSWGTARISFTTNDTTNGHTIIFKLALACDAPNGGLTDDPAYGANNAFTTVTIGGGAVANASYQTNTAAVTGGGCAAGSLVHWKLFRDTDTSSDTAVAVTGWLEVNYQAQYQ